MGVLVDCSCTCGFSRQQQECPIPTDHITLPVSFLLYVTAEATSQVWNPSPSRSQTAQLAASGFSLASSSGQIARSQIPCFESHVQWAQRPSAGKPPGPSLRSTFLMLLFSSFWSRAPYCSCRPHCAQTPQRCSYAVSQCCQFFKGCEPLLIQ